MSWLIARTFGVLAVAAALTTSHASALAASPAINSPHYATKLKKTSTLVGLSPQMATRAIQAARSRPNAPRLTTQGSSAAPEDCVTDSCLDALCGQDDWFITWDEDANGNPISHTFQLFCGGATVPIG